MPAQNPWASSACQYVVEMLSISVSEHDAEGADA